MIGRRGLQFNDDDVWADMCPALPRAQGRLELVLPEVGAMADDWTRLSVPLARWENVCSPLPHAPRCEMWKVWQCLPQPNEEDWT